MSKKQYQERWSDTRKAIFNMRPGDALEFPSSEDSNARISCMRLQAVESETRTWSCKKSRDKVIVLCKRTIPDTTCVGAGSLGDTIKDRLTNKTGLAIGYTVWLYGEPRVCMQVEIAGGKFETDWIDAVQTEVVSHSSVNWPGRSSPEDVIVPLGAVGRDRLSGFEGVIRGYTKWLYGDATVALGRYAFDLDAPTQEHWFPVNQVMFVKSSAPGQWPGSVLDLGLKHLLEERCRPVPQAESYDA